MKFLLYRFRLDWNLLSMVQLTIWQDGFRQWPVPYWYLPQAHCLHFFWCSENFIILVREWTPFYRNEPVFNSCLPNQITAVETWLINYSLRVHIYNTHNPVCGVATVCQGGVSIYLEIVAFSLKIYCGFNIEPNYSYVCVYQSCPHPLAEINIIVGFSGHQGNYIRFWYVYAKGPCITTILWHDAVASLLVKESEAFVEKGTGPRISIPMPFPPPPTSTPTQNTHTHAPFTQTN